MPEPEVLAVATQLAALSHPTRLRIVLVMDSQSASPSSLAGQLDLRLPELSYHVRCLVTADLLELVGTRPRRGAIEHFYELTPRGVQLRDLAARVMRAARGSG